MSFGFCSRQTAACCAASSLIGFSHASTPPRGDDPFADTVIAYLPGPSPSPGYTNSAAALGQPERFTGEGIFPSVVSPFSPAYGTDELVSLSPGGSIVLRFDTPITNDPNNLHGIDLIIFGNTGFIDGDFPNAIVAGVFSNDGGTVEVSSDGVDWRLVADAAADDLMPTCGYLDSGAFDTTPGSAPTDFTRPTDPALEYAHVAGLNLAGLLMVYRGSGGGTGVDLASTGLAAISFVRISLHASASDNMELDAVADASPRLAGDVNLDGSVNVADLLGVIAAWGSPTPGGVPADLNNDGLINVADLLLVIVNWGA